ncbi:GNAT family N-acetyltransferase [Neobacillus notoginsengisoli]|uniref:GNAT family N-acetyltransferase n=1 Tax=Neobacillus notoginsengisoli TaxID=1578198 RepID=A0A417YRV4_9BACI|nr:GNAT family N-acetyltransferase [Neobacillus notoginsengisoli]RHW38027.1 GNAT family N-acetyltransferase [Neobacillus notoginsengisoli]
MLTLIKVDKNQEETLHHLMQFYFYDFSVFKPEIRLETDGTYKRFQLDEYWADEHHHPFFIQLEDELIGFALVTAGLGQSSNSIEEFHIIRKYTGHGYGKIAAQQLFAMFQGKWRITQIQANEPAKAFWRKTIRSYTGGDYTEHTDDHGRTIQEFTTVEVSS